MGRHMKPSFNQVTAKGDVAGNTVSIAMGNLGFEKTGAAIVPQFNDEVSTDGVGRGILEGGGLSGMNAYRDILAANGDELEFGQAFLVKSGGPHARHLIHVVSVNSGRKVEFKTIKTSFYNALKEAEKNGVREIAAPALGTGAMGYLSNEQSAEAMMSALKQYGDEGGKPLRVKFVIYNDPQAVDDFTNVLATKSYATADENQQGKRGTSPIEDITAPHDHRDGLRSFQEKLARAGRWFLRCLLCSCYTPSASY